MTRDDWRDWIERIGIVAIIGSLIFVGLQMRQDHQLARAQNSADFDDTMIEYARVINANREIWKMGLEGEELSPVDQITFEAVAYTVWQKFFGLYTRTGLLGYRPASEVAKQLAGELYIFPGLRRYFITRCVHGESLGFPRPFCGDVMEQLGKFDDGTWPLPEEKIYVF
jgi:hypothetical protein